MRFLITLLCMLALAAPALASDGVLEINQTCAVQTGCFGKDEIGYPVTIDGSAGHSYRLTSDLILPDENTSGIVVSTSDVGIDLNNFAIIRSGCEDATTSCAPASGTGVGVATDPLNHGISVKNGSITGMANGVDLGEQAEVSNLRVRWNRSSGIAVGGGSTLWNNTAYQNGGDGLFVYPGSTVSGNTAYDNGRFGLNVFYASSITGNTAYSNASDGIRARDSSTVSGNTVSANGADGISVDIGSLVIGNTVYGNGTSGTGYGLNLGSDSAYRDNLITGPVTATRGTVTGSGVDAGGNVCNGLLTCP